jgi:hypothetical protein
MRQFLHMQPKGRRGRPKGSGLQQHTTEALELHRRAYTAWEMCRELGIPRNHRTRLEARIRSAIRRLPEDERQAIVDARKEARKRRKAAASHTGS